MVATACALKEASLRDAQIRAGASVGFPTRVVVDAQSARVEFTHRGTRVCPVSRFFVYCHSTKEGCKGG